MTPPHRPCVLPDGVAAVKYLAATLLALLSIGSIWAESNPPSRATIVGIAQHFVQEQYMHGSLGHYHIEFDVAYLHPQPEKDFWAVVGGFVSDQNTRNIFVAAVRLICSDTTDVACWRLEKLAINQKIIVDRSKPL